MKKIFTLLLSISFLSGAQVVKVPQKIQFTDITVNLDATAQKIIQNEVNTLLLPSKFLDSKLERMQLYLPVIENILTEEEVPLDFKYTPVTESSLIPDAVSTSSAVGYWQIKGMTGQELGLRIDNEIDERQSIFASTRAAALYLKRNNILYKNWVSTLYSYYLGATGVSKFIPQDWQFNDEITILGTSDRYLFKNFAQKLAFEDRISRLREPKFSIFEYKTGKGKTLEMIARELNVNLDDLKSYNTWLKVNQIPNDKEYSVAVVVPTEQFSDLVTNVRKTEKETDFVKDDVGFPILKKITISSIDPEAPIYYEINDKKGIISNIGDTYETIAQRAKVDPKDFLAFNDLQPNDMIEGDVVYYLEKKDKKAKIPFHTVKDEQSLRQISNIYGVQLATILKNNRMENVQRVQPGRVLWLRKRRPRNKPVEYLTDYSTPEKPKTDIENKDTKVVINPPVVSSSGKDKKDDEGWIEVPVEGTPSTTTKPFPTDDKTSSSTKPKPYTPEPSKGTNTNPSDWNKQEQPAKTGEITTTPNTSPAKPSSTSSSTVITNANASYHSVDVGNTVYSISRQYGVSVKNLYAWNGLNADSKLYIGQQILISNPTGTATSASSTSSEPKYVPSSTSNIERYSTHTVQSGENLFRIGLKYNVSVDQIKNWNNLKENNVKVGQKLKIRQ